MILRYFVMIQQFYTFCNLLLLLFMMLTFAEMIIFTDKRICTWNVLLGLFIFIEILLLIDFFFFDHKECLQLS